MFTKARHWTLYRASQIQLVLSQPTSVWYILVLSSNLRLESHVIASLYGLELNQLLFYAYDNLLCKTINTIRKNTDAY
jgi:hypothetical protein